MADDTKPPVPVSYSNLRSAAIFQGGLEGKRPTVPISAEQLEQKAKEALAPEAFDYVAGGAGSEDTLRANRAAFQKWRIVPRMLRDITRRDLSIELFGARLIAPVLLAPIGQQAVVHPEAELAVARAAASLGFPMVLSGLSSVSLEDVAAALGDTPRWFQLYWSNVPELAASFVARAERAGYSAIVITLDSMLLGWRERELQNAYLPSLHGLSGASYYSDPVFRSLLAASSEEDRKAAILQLARVFSDPSLTWERLAFLREHTRLPLLLKGIQHPDDAARAVDYGMDGVIVSNHGARQIDGAIGSLDALPGVVKAVDGRIPVLFDSGIRRGADAIKALALGARAVLLGRPYVWGLALAGEQGVREVLLNFLADLDTTLGLCGCVSCAELGPDTLWREE